MSAEVFLPKRVTPTQVFATRKYLMRSFYSWRNILLRWSRLMWAYWWSGKARKKAVGSALITYVLLKLSTFQRYHALHRVFPTEPPAVPEAAHQTRTGDLRNAQRTRALAVVTRQAE